MMLSTRISSMLVVHLHSGLFRVCHREIGTGAKPQWASGRKKRVYGVAIGGGLLAGSLWAFMQKNHHEEKKLLLQSGQQLSGESYMMVAGKFGKMPVARTVRTTADNTGMKLTLFQYQTCPFCCKARAFLDYYGLNYDVVEVNSVTRKQLKWSTTYKKVPMLVAEMDSGQQFQLVDSSLIVSSLFSFLVDRPAAADQGGLKSIMDCYPQMNTVDPQTGKDKLDILNKYFIMYQGRDTHRDKKAILDERKWRKWVDDTLVHMLSPNVYRTPSEALQAFEWFDRAGDWPNHFATWERYLVIYVGSVAMWLIGKRLKKRHHLKDDVRQALYDEVNFWLKSIRQKGTPFMGGDTPDLSDLAVYGVLSAIEGCQAFQDLLSNTNLEPWYSAVKEACKDHQGQTIFSQSTK